MKNGLRNLCYAVWTVLGLVLIAHNLRREAVASGVAQTAGNVVGTSAGAVLTTNGEAYYAGGGHWNLTTNSPNLPLPIPVSEIAFVAGTDCNVIIDAAGNGWVAGAAQWEQIGPVPGGSGPTAVTPQTWSQIKGQYAPKSGGGE